MNSEPEEMRPEDPERPEPGSAPGSEPSNGKPESPETDRDEPEHFESSSDFGSEFHEPENSESERLESEEGRDSDGESRGPGQRSAPYGETKRRETESSQPSCEREGDSGEGFESDDERSGSGLRHGPEPDGYLGSGSEARRLHPSSMLFEALKTARSWASAAAIPAVASFFGSGLSWWLIALIAVGAILLLAASAVWGFLSWRATSYWVSGGAFHLRSGVLQKNERTIPLEHVQSVDTVQGFVQRVIGSVSSLKVVEVRIETAGGSATETDASLAALTRGDATSLRRGIEGARREAVGDEEEAGPDVIRMLTSRELLIAGATSGQIGAAAAIIGVASQFLDDFVDGLFSQNFVEGIVETVAPYAFLAVMLIVFAVGLFAWLLAIAGTVFSYSGFTISRSADGKYLNIKRGLIRRYEATIPISRIQAIRITEGLLRQPFGLAMIRVESAGYGGGAEDVGVSTTLFPLIPRRQIRAFLAETAPDFAVEPPLTPLPTRAARRYIFRAAAPWLIMFAAAGAFLSISGLSAEIGPAVVGFADVPLPPEIYFAIPAALILILAALYGWAAYRAAGWAISDDCFVSRSRTLARTTAIAPRRRLQSRHMSRSPFQRRVRLATLQTRVASGSGGTTFEVVDMESSSAREVMSRLGPRKSSEW